MAGFDRGPARTIFSTRDQGHARDRYFLDSGGAVRFFFEEEAPDELNKIGHALHDLDPVFDRLSRQPKLAALVQELGLAEPLLLQSMYIFKQPGIGGEVGWHQDATFLYTTPITVTGFWFALDDADRDNGCLLALTGAPSRAAAQALPPLRRGMVMESVDYHAWPTVEPTAIEVRRGSLVVLHGLLPHASSANRSPRPRQAYAVHLIDGRASYSPDNWLQRPDFRCEVFVIPKAELHCHLEGSVPPALARELAARNGLDLPAGLFGADGHYVWRDFLSFLDSYDRVCGVLRKPRDFGDIFYSYLQRTAAEGAVYVEMFCSPERPKALGIPYADWVAALVDAIDRARRDFGIEARIIGICIRHLGPDRALALAQQIVAEPHPYVVALGMGGDEAKFARPNSRRPTGWRTTRAWAAPSMPARSLGPGERVGRDPRPAGNPHRPWRALDRGSGAGRGAGAPRKSRSRSAPAATLHSACIPTAPPHPLHRLIAAGVRVTLEFGRSAFLPHDARGGIRQGGADAAALRKITRTAIEVSFADEATKAKLLKGVAA